MVVSLQSQGFGIAKGFGQADRTESEQEYNPWKKIGDRKTYLVLEIILNNV
jgi:hypothetical protein